MCSDCDTSRLASNDSRPHGSILKCKDKSTQITMMLIKEVADMLTDINPSYNKFFTLILS